MAAAISLYGFESGAALATVVGVLIEVPVMLAVVRVVNGTKGWYEREQRVGDTPPILPICGGVLKSLFSLTLWRIVSAASISAAPPNPAFVIFP